MVPRILRLPSKTFQKLERLRREAEQDGAYRVAKRLHAVLLNSYRGKIPLDLDAGNRFLL